MRDRLVELIKQANEKCRSTKNCDDCSACDTGDEPDDCLKYNIADHLLANGVIVPPYKCGTVVYVLRSQTSNGENLYMRQERIEQYRTSNNGTFMTFESGRISVRNDQWNGSVFATPEEAERALKGEHNAEIH